MPTIKIQNKQGTYLLHDPVPFKSPHGDALRAPTYDYVGKETLFTSELPGLFPLKDCELVEPVQDGDAE